ncbi:MAG: 2'-5' RNA ligase family protein [Candidatus Paceibacterota bacterium]
MGKYVIVCILEAEFPQEFQYVDWPSHTTLLRPFTTDTSSQKLAETLQSICEQHHALTTEGKSRELFGPASDVPVIELVNTPELQKLHDDIRTAYIQEIEFTAPQYPDFRPHVTENNGKGVEVGESVKISSLSLVELTLESHNVLNTFLLQ